LHSQILKLWIIYKWFENGFEKMGMKNNNILEKDLVELEDEIKGSLEENWNKCLKIIGDNVNKQVMKTWFLPIRAVSHDNFELNLGVPSQFFYEWIIEHYSDLVKLAIKKTFGEQTELSFQIVFDSAYEEKKSTTIKLPGFKSNNNSSQASLPFAPINIKEKQINSNLNPRYSFDNFITGDSNQLARSASVAVSQKPGKTRFNPLVLYGDTGLGKTHLVQAIGNYISANNFRTNVLYTNSEKFTNDFIEAIQNNKISEFVNNYRNVDVLIVDDIQFFANKEKTQDNFFHTFNALYQAGKQIILTSDRSPSELTDVDQRLISRFKWGLVADITQPDYEMRMAILQRKSSDEGIDLPNSIAEYLARHIKSNIRELEGALISLIAKVTLDRRQLNLELAKEVVYGISTRQNQEIDIDFIKKTVSDYFKIDTALIVSKSRKQEIALARHMAIYFAKLLTPMSLKSIGNKFGNRDHSTVLHSCKTIDNYIETDPKVKSSYENILAILRGE